MKKRSLIFRERLNEPLETAIFWIDHIIKHQDSSHLRPGSVQLAWFELYSLDVLVIVGFIIFSIVYSLKLIISFIGAAIWLKKIEKAKDQKRD